MEVRTLLKSLPQEEMWLFTNCSEKHALHALELLNLKVPLPFSEFPWYQVCINVKLYEEDCRHVGRASARDE